MTDKASDDAPVSRGEVLRLFDQPMQVRSFILTAILVLMSFYTLYFARYLFIPLALALLLNLLLGPVVARLRRWHIPRPLGAALVLGLLVTTVGAGIYGLAGPAQAWFDKSPQLIEQFRSETWAIRADIRQLTEKAQEVQQAASRIVGSSGDKGPDASETSLGATVITKAQWFASILLLTVVMLYFMLASHGILLKKLLAITRRGHARRKAVRIVRSLQHEISVYLVTVTAINTTLGAITAGGLMLIGMPNPVLWGALAGVLNFAPYVGAAVAWTMISVVGFVSLDGLWLSVAPSLFFLALSFLEGNFITPTVHGKRFAMSPLVILLSLFLWGWLWGVAGMLMAVPLVVALKVSFDHIEELRPLARMLGR